MGAMGERKDMNTAWGEPFQSPKTDRWIAWSLIGPRAKCDACDKMVQEDEPRLRVAAGAGETLPGASHRASDGSSFFRQYICERCALEQEGVEVSKWAYRRDA